MKRGTKITPLRVAGLVVGLAAIGMMGYQVTILIRMRVSFSLRLVTSLLLYWPRSLWWLVQFMPRVGVPLTPLVLAYLSIHVAAIVLSVLLARTLKHSGLDWGVVALLVPYLAPAILVFLRPRRAPETGLIRRFFAALFSGGGGARTRAEKRCNRCGQQVPLSARRGQRCPHCGAYWSGERMVHR